MSPGTRTAALRTGPGPLCMEHSVLVLDLCSREHPPLSGGPVGSQDLAWTRRRCRCREVIPEPMTTPGVADITPIRLRCAVVLKVEEHVCEARAEGAVFRARFAPQFPSPRTERVSPGHLVAVARAPDERDVVVWRWYDAVVLGEEVAKSVRLWEPAHGEVVARPRQSDQQMSPGRAPICLANCRARNGGSLAPRWPSRGSRCRTRRGDRLYTDNALWAAAFEL